MYEQQNKNNTKMENSMATMTNASIMKYGCHHIINNAVHYYQTPYDIALILEQVSNYNILLREQIQTEKETFAKQDNVISDEKCIHQNCVHQQRNACLKGRK